MAIRTFEERLTPQDLIDIKNWDKRLKSEDKSYENAKRRDRYHNLQSLDENVSLDGRATERYDLIASNSLNGEQYCINNELVDTVCNYISSLDIDEQYIIIGKLDEKPMPSSAIAEIVECSDKTVTNHFKKHQEVLQKTLKDYR